MVTKLATIAITMAALVACSSAPDVRPMQAEYLTKIAHPRIISTISQRGLTAQYDRNEVPPGYTPGQNLNYLGLGAAGSILASGFSAGLAAVADEDRVRAALGPRIDGLDRLAQSLKGFDFDSVLQQGVRSATTQVSWLKGGAYETSTKSVADILAGARTGADSNVMVIDTAYTMSTDFQALILIAHVSLYSRNIRMPHKPNTPVLDWASDPVYRNDVVCQSKRLALPDKTQADIDWLMAEVNQKYDMTKINADLAQVNKADLTPETIRKRTQLSDELRQRYLAVRDAQQPTWTRAQKYAKLAKIWGDNNAALLKLSVQQGENEIINMLLIDLMPHAQGDGKGDFVISSRDGRVEYYPVSGPEAGFFVSSMSGDKIGLGH